MNSQATKVLLIDDDEDDFVITRNLLAGIEGDSFDLDWESSYTTAVSTIKARQHDVYLIDYRLGEHNGVDLVRLVIESGCKSPVLMLTGQGERGVDIEATKAGAADYLIKGSITSAWLERSIRHALDRMRAAEALRLSEERYHDLFENCNDLIQIANPDGLIVYVNSVWKRVLGYEADEVRQLSFFDIVHPNSRANCVEAFSRAVAGEKVGYFEAALMTRDGRTIAVEGNITCALKNGKPTSMQGIFRDISGRKVMEQALLKSEELLQQSQKMEAIGTLAGGVAHDFNNLLTAILGNTYFALSGLQPDNPLQLRLVEVEKAANRAAVLTRQLLAFSRRQHLERRAINLNDTINEIMKLLQRIIGEDVEVRVIPAPGLAAVFADPAQIEQVIMNLAVNARDAMPQGGKLTIETSSIEFDGSYQHQYPYAIPGKYAQINVSDTGNGIDAETQKRIFEPFFTTKEVGKGTGLGLSMVYGIVKQHDGHINVYSEVGHGTTFKVFLPIVASAIENEMLTLELPLCGGTETILIAEDEEALRNLARDILEGLDYTVLLAKNGEEAVEMYKSNRERIDLLLLDVVMPHLGGIEAYERIRDLGGELPLIFVTGYSAETVQSRFVKRSSLLEASGATVLQKPYNLDGLGRKVRETLDKQAMVGNG